VVVEGPEAGVLDQTVALGLGIVVCLMSRVTSFAELAVAVTLSVKSVSATSSCFAVFDFADFERGAAAVDAGAVVVAFDFN